MNAIACVFGFFAFVAMVQAGQEEDDKTKALEVHTKCAAKTGVNVEDVAKARSGDWSVENDSLKKYTRCYYEQIGVVDANGDFQKDVFLAHLRPQSEKEKGEKTIDECLSKPKPSSAEEFTYQLSKCYLSALPTHTVVP